MGFEGQLAAAAVRIPRSRANRHGLQYQIPWASTPPKLISSTRVNVADIAVHSVVLAVSPRRRNNGL